MEPSFIDWNGNGKIDSSDIAISLAVESAEICDQQEKPQFECEEKNQEC